LRLSKSYFKTAIWNQRMAVFIGRSQTYHRCTLMHFIAHVTNRYYFQSPKTALPESGRGQKADVSKTIDF
jgi:hypothetical protein